jgi:hypothetical protein
MRKLLFEESAQEDLFFWVGNDAKMLKRIVDIIENIQKPPLYTYHIFSQIKKMKKVTFLAIVLVFLIFCTKSSFSQTDTTKIFELQEVEEQAQFPGGIDNLIKYIAETKNYSQEMDGM